MATASSQESVRVNGGYVRVLFDGALNPPKTPGFSRGAWVHPEWSAGETAGETGVFRCVVASREDTGAKKHGYILYAGPKLDPVTFAVIGPAMYWLAWVGDGRTWQMLVGPCAGPRRRAHEPWRGRVTPAPGGWGCRHHAPI